MRSRLLLSLLVLDALAGLCFGLNTVPTILLAEVVSKTESRGIIILFFGQLFLMVSCSHCYATRLSFIMDGNRCSFTWMGAIAFHAYLVVSSDIAENTKQELLWERRYRVIVFVLMACLFLPLDAYFEFAQDIQTNAAARENFELLWQAFMVAQWIFVSALCIRMHCGSRMVLTEAAKTYRRQITTFVVVFLLLTCQTLAYNLAVLTKTYNYNLASYRYLSFFGGQFYQYMGLVNAVTALIEDLFVFDCCLCR